MRGVACVDVHYRRPVVLNVRGVAGAEETFNKQVQAVVLPTGRLLVVAALFSHAGYILDRIVADRLKWFVTASNGMLHLLDWHDKGEKPYDGPEDRAGAVEDWPAGATAANAAYWHTRKLCGVRERVNLPAGLAYLQHPRMTLMQGGGVYAPDDRGALWGIVLWRSGLVLASKSIREFLDSVGETW